MSSYILKDDLRKLIDGPVHCGLHHTSVLGEYVCIQDIQKLPLKTERQIIEETFLEKGQNTRRFKLGETWQLNFSEILEVLDELFGPKDEDQ